MTSLGNIECTPFASLTFVDFSTGDVLYLTGTAKNLVGQEVQTIMPFTNALTLIHTTGYIFVRDAIPIGQKEGTVSNPSPYSPPVRLLAEESSMSLFGKDDRPDALLTEIVIRSGQVITLRWESTKDLEILPGQAIILDCSALLGTRQYQHMAALNPISVNDDHIRTWTVSSASTTGHTTRTFAITIRHKIGGALTTAFFSIAQKLEQMRKELLNDTRSLALTVKVAGITGEFTLPPSLSSPVARGLVWFAGGIGVTPFLSMLESLRECTKGEEVNVRLVLSARDPTTLLNLIYEKYNGKDNTPNTNVHLTLDVFYSQHDSESGDFPTSQGVVLQQYPRRLDAKYIMESMREELIGREVYVCGPDEYMRTVMEAATAVGVERDHIHSEGFTY
jgi:ferredoxin-NADP reductase